MDEFIDEFNKLNVDKIPFEILNKYYINEENLTLSESIYRKEYFKEDNSTLNVQIYENLEEYVKKRKNYKTTIEFFKKEGMEFTNLLFYSGLLLYALPVDESIFPRYYYVIDNTPTYLTVPSDCPFIIIPHFNTVLYVHTGEIIFDHNLLNPKEVIQGYTYDIEFEEKVDTMIKQQGWNTEKDSNKIRKYRKNLTVLTKLEGIFKIEKYTKYISINLDKGTNIFILYNYSQYFYLVVHRK